MRAIVIPVKAFAGAKSRLARFLAPGARTRLAEAMCADVFEVVAQTRCTDRVFVVSNEARAICAARANGWEVLVEEEQRSESASVDMASRHCEAHGFTSVVRLPTDIPLVRSSDIEVLFDAVKQTPGCIIVASRDGTGTNALLRSPPMVFASHFGRDSFGKHLSAARMADIPVTIVRNSRIELDIDEPDDLALLRNSVLASSHTGIWFSETNRVPAAVSDRDLFLRANPGGSRG